MITQSTLIAMVLTVITGDASGLGDMGVGLGSLLITSGYSRRFETEADQFAFEQMLKAGIDPSAFASIMSKITSDIATEEQTTIDDPDTGHEAESSDLTDYLSTHPNTKARIALAHLYAKCFEQGLRVCDPAKLASAKSDN